LGALKTRRQIDRPGWRGFANECRWLREVKINANVPVRTAVPGFELFGKSGGAIHNGHVDSFSHQSDNTLLAKKMSPRP
jgi:hypothetical protein